MAHTSTPRNISDVSSSHFTRPDRNAPASERHLAPRDGSKGTHQAMIDQAIAIPREVSASSWPTPIDPCFGWSNLTTSPVRNAIEIAGAFLIGRRRPNWTRSLSPPGGNACSPRRGVVMSPVHKTTPPATNGDSAQPILTYPHSNELTIPISSHLTWTGNRTSCRAPLITPPLLQLTSSFKNPHATCAIQLAIQRPHSVNPAQRNADVRTARCIDIPKINSLKNLPSRLAFIRIRVQDHRAGWSWPELTEKGSNEIIRGHVFLRHSVWLRAAKR